MAKAEKIYAIAEKLGYEGVPAGNTVDAINAVAETLGYDGAPARRITDALADLYTVAEGGGGGGGNIGDLVTFPIGATAVPQIGSAIEGQDIKPVYLGIGGKPIVGGTLTNLQRVAAGVEFGFYDMAGYAFTGYIARTVPPEGAGAYVVESITPWDGTFEHMKIGSDNLIVFTMPAMVTSAEYFENFVIVVTQEGDNSV